MKNRIELINTVLSILMFFIGTVAFGQGSIDDSEISIQKNKEITLPVVEKEYATIMLENKIKDFDEKIEYDQKTFEISLEEPQSKNRVLRLKKDKLEKLYPGYLELGFGNYGTSLINIDISNKRSKDYSFGLNFDHLASFNGPVDNSGISDNQLVGYATKYWNKLALGNETSYKYNKVRFYGYDHNELSISNADSITQDGNDFNTKFKYDLLTSKLTSNGYVFLNSFSLPWTNSLRIGYNTENSYDINRNFKVLLASGLSINQIKISGNELSRSIFNIKPSVGYKNDNLDVNAGTNISIGTGDTILYSSTFHIYPIINAGYMLNKTTKINFNWEGKLKENTMSGLYENNPYIDSVEYIFNTNVKSDMNIGIDRVFKDKLFFGLSVGTAAYENLNNFASSARDSSRYDILWNTGNINVLRLNFSGKYKVTNQLEVGLNYILSSYNPDIYDHVYYMPSGDAKVSIKYFIKDKAKIEFSGRYVDGLWGYDQKNDISEKLDPIIDLNLKSTYYVSKKMGVYIRLNNIIAKKYLYYINYPKKGFNFIAGLNYSF